MNIRNLAYLFIVIIAIVAFLILAQDLLIPFVFALLLWFVVRDIRSYLDRFSFIEKRFPFWLKNLISLLLIIMLLTFTSRVITSSINELAQSYRSYEANVDSLLNRLNEILDIDVMQLMKENSGDLDFGKILGSVFDSLTGILSSSFMIIIYALFVFLEESNFIIKLQKIFVRQEQFDKVNSIISSIDYSIKKYLKLKTFVSLLTGVLSYFVLMLIGVESPVFWAFLIFILNYITTIGSLIGTVFPAIFCLLQFGEFTPALMVLLFVGAIQVLVGNIIEPRLMGDSMNISSLVTIIALSVWGAIWGVTGMILSVPITVIMVIIFSQFPATRSIAILLSDKGNVSQN